MARADAALERDERAMAKRVRRVYEAEMESLSREVSALYERYGTGSVLRYRDLLQRLSDGERDLLMRDCEAFAAAHPEHADMVEVRKGIWRLDRLEGLQASVRVHLARATAEAEEGMGEHFARHAANAANAVAEAMGYGSSFHTVDDEIVRRCVGVAWNDGRNYSDTLWGDAAKIAAHVQDDMSKAFARGDSWQRVCDAVSRRFVGVAERDVMRLVVTEGTYAARQAQAAEFRREGFEEYRLEPVADGRTCEGCSAMEGRRFRLDEARVGANFPPLHPRCRCQIAPAVDDWGAWQRAQLDRKRAELAARRAGGRAGTNPLNPVPGKGSVVYGKPACDLMPHERRGIDDLVRLGYEVAVPREDPHAPANIDLLLGHDGQPWEMKNVGDGRHSVNDLMRSAYHKWTRLGFDSSEARIVITSYGATRDEEEIMAEVKRRMRRYAKAVIYILRDGSLGHYFER